MAQNPSILPLRVCVGWIPAMLVVTTQTGYSSFQIEQEAQPSASSRVNSGIGGRAAVSTDCCKPTINIMEWLHSLERTINIEFQYLKQN